MLPLLGHVALEAGDPAARETRDGARRHGGQDAAPADEVAEQVREPGLLHAHHLVEAEEGEADAVRQRDQGREEVGAILRSEALFFVAAPAGRPARREVLRGTLPVLGEIAQRRPDRGLDVRDRQDRHQRQQAEIHGVEALLVEPGLLAVHRAVLLPVEELLAAEHPDHAEHERDREEGAEGFGEAAVRAGPGGADDRIGRRQGHAAAGEHREEDEVRVVGEPGRLRIAHQAADERHHADRDRREAEGEEGLGQDAGIGALTARCSGAHWAAPPAAGAAAAGAAAAVCWLAS